MRNWVVKSRRDSVAVLHGIGIGESPQRTVRWCQPADGAIVLGSSQKESDIDPVKVASHGLSIVKRASGGGAVLVEPNEIFWVDVILPADDSLWVSDVGVAFMWLGHVWKQTLEKVGCSNVTVHEGAMTKTPWSYLVCYSGLGPGECLMSGRKVVGISQRRQRRGVLFQCSIPLRFDIDRMLDIFSLDSENRQSLRDQLSRSVDVIPVSPTDLWAAFLSALGTRY